MSGPELGEYRGEDGEEGPEVLGHRAGVQQGPEVGHLVVGLVGHLHRGGGQAAVLQEGGGQKGRDVGDPQGRQAGGVLRHVLHPLELETFLPQLLPLGLGQSAPQLLLQPVKLLLLLLAELLEGRHALHQPVAVLEEAGAERSYH